MTGNQNSNPCGGSDNLSLRRDKADEVSLVGSRNWLDPKTYESATKLGSIEKFPSFEILPADDGDLKIFDRNPPLGDYRKTNTVESKYTPRLETTRRLNNKTMCIEDMDLFLPVQKKKYIGKPKRAVFGSIVGNFTTIEEQKARDSTGTSELGPGPSLNAASGFDRTDSFQQKFEAKKKMFEFKRKLPKTNPKSLGFNRTCAAGFGANKQNPKEKFSKVIEFSPVKTKTNLFTSGENLDPKKHLLLQRNYNAPLRKKSQTIPKKARTHRSTAKPLSLYS
jgi:hypothetical protein